MLIVAVLRSNKKPSPPRYKPDKQKGTPAAFLGFGPARIELAYKDLTNAAFAVWMRLVVADESDLKSGRAHIASLLGRSQRTSDRWLHELRRKGYISFIRKGSFRPTEIIIERQPLISARGRFLRIS